MTYDDLQTIRWLGAGVSAEVYKVLFIVSISFGR